MKKCLALITLAVIFSLSAAAQPSNPAVSTQYGFDTPNPGGCGSANVGSQFIRSGDRSGNYTGEYRCVQTGPQSLGAAAYEWLGVAYAPPGTTATTGTLQVANGKTAVISNSLRLRGADSTILDFPAVSSGIPGAYFCGPTSGAATCPNLWTSTTARVIGGLATLASNSAVISGISPAFTSTTSFSCTSNDQTTVGNPTKVLNTSTSSITVSNTTGASDTVAWICIGY